MPPAGTYYTGGYHQSHPVWEINLRPCIHSCSLTDNPDTYL